MNMLMYFEIPDIVIMSSISFFIAALHFYTAKYYGLTPEPTFKDAIYLTFKGICYAIIVYLICFFTLCLFTNLILNIFYFP